MKLIYIVIITFIIGSLTFSRSFISDSKIEKLNSQLKNKHYWVKDLSDGKGEIKLDRKRSHKRRRKIRKPIKGLR